MLKMAKKSFQIAITPNYFRPILRNNQYSYLSFALKFFLSFTSYLICFEFYVYLSIPTHHRSNLNLGLCFQSFDSREYIQQWLLSVICDQTPRSFLESHLSKFSSFILSFPTSKCICKFYGLLFLSELKAYAQGFFLKAIQISHLQFAELFASELQLLLNSIPKSQCLIRCSLYIQSIYLSRDLFFEGFLPVFAMILFPLIIIKNDQSTNIHSIS